MLLSLTCALNAAISVRRRVRRAEVACSSLGEVETSPSSRTTSLPSIREAKRVVLVRHGQSTWNEEGRIQGSSDYSVLTAKGETQADTSRQMLLGDAFDACFTSPLIRSRRTAEIIWGDRKEQLISDSDLREIDLYSFQGLLKDEGKERFGGLFRQWQKDAANFNIDGHYPVRELWDRAQNCWERILANEGKSVLVVAHNAVNQALVATALGLGVEYFRILLQSNCGASVLDFTPQTGGSPNVCLNRLNQTPNSPVASGSSAGRKAKKRIILVCQGATESSVLGSLARVSYEPLNMLGVIQSQKTAELLLDVKLNRVLCSPRVAAVDTAMPICEVQEAADCLGADCVPRSVEVKKLLDLEIDPIFEKAQKNFAEPAIARSGWLSSFDYEVLKELWARSKTVWQTLLDELSDESTETNLVVVGHPAIHIALICQCLNLTMEWMRCFHLDAGSVSVIDFPDGPAGRGIIRCTNYTAHLGRWSIPITRTLTNEEEF